jgi:hypothetical protein
MFMIPYYCFTTCLAWIKEANVNNWVNMVMRDITTKLGSYHYFHISEQLWKDFWANFETTFADSAVLKTAQAELASLVLNEKDPDAYVAHFKTLLRYASYD